MPPTPKYTKDELLDAAFMLLKEESIDAVTARGIGQRLGVSSSPVFTWFNSMDELYDALRNKSWRLFADYMLDKTGNKLSFTDKLISFVHFVRDNPKVFEFIFLKTTGKYSEILNDYFFFLKEDIENIKEAYGFSEKQASDMIEKQWIFALGIGVLMANNIKNYSDHDLKKMFLI